MFVWLESHQTDMFSLHRSMSQGSTTESVEYRSSAPLQCSFDDVLYERWPNHYHSPLDQRTNWKKYPNWEDKHAKRDSGEVNYATRLARFGLFLMRPCMVHHQNGFLESSCSFCNARINAAPEIFKARLGVAEGCTTNHLTNSVHRWCGLWCGVVSALQPHHQAPANGL